MRRPEVKLVKVWWVDVAITPTVRKLSSEEFRSTFGAPMDRQASDAAPLFDFWPYVEAIPRADYQGFDCSPGVVEYVYRNSAATFEHVLINSEDRNAFMVVVLDLQAGRVHGHRLLDLNEEYGLDLC